MTSFLDLFKSELILINNFMNESKMKDFIDYINLTYFNHFHLYKYVFTTERDSQILNEEKHVYTPAPALIEKRLTESKHNLLFAYDNKLADLEIKENKLNEYFQTERERLAKQEKNLINLIKTDDFDDNTPINEEVIF